MASSVSSIAFVSATLFALASVGLSGHLRQTERVPFAGFLDGSAQALYETRFDDAHIVAAAAVDTLSAVNFAIFGQASEGAIVSQKGWLFTTEELETTGRFEANIVASAEHVAKVVTSLEQKGIAVLPVIVPDKSDIYAGKLGLERPEPVKNRLGLFYAELSARGIAFLDGRSVLNTAALEGEVFLKDDTHWSPLGSRKMARAVAQSLNHIDLSEVVVTTSRGPAIPYDGDLLAFVSTGRWRPFVGPEQFEIETFKTRLDAKGGLFEALDVEVALVGTSFSARPAFHFEGFLKDALRADVLNFAQEGQGPFAPMDAFLVSDFLKTTPPKVVIWEIPVRYLSKDL